jgi:drug/metabolite transporter (DMT)-like permease
MQQSSRSNFVRGAFYGISAVSIWAAFIVVSRLGVRTSLTPWDVAAIRFGTAGVLLLPYFMKKGFAVDRLGGWELQPSQSAAAHLWCFS